MSDRMNAVCLLRHRLGRLFRLMLVGLALPLMATAAPHGKTPDTNPDTNTANKSLTPAQKTAEYDAIEAYLQGIKSMESRFIQQGPDGSMTEGNMHLKRPGKLRFDYGKDSPLLLVSDGDILSFIDYDIKQVTRWPIADTPLGVLVAKKVDLSKDLDITRMAMGDGLLRVTVKDPDHVEEGFITLIFDASPLALRAWEVTDAQGLKTRVTLIDPVVNVPVKNSLFTFKDPRTLPMTGRRRH